MSAAPTQTCPSCHKPLVAESLPARATVLCANCRHRFTPGAAAAERTPTSGKAVASLALGLAAMFAMCLTGVPAIVTGILALRDIRRSEGQTRGRGLAITGIVTGAVFGILCMPISTAALLSALQIMLNPPREYVDAAQIAALIQKMPEHRPPASVTPIYGFEDPRSGLRQVIYADPPHQPTTLVFMSQAAASNASTRDVLEAQMRGWEQGRSLTIAVQDSQTLPWTIAGRQVEVTRQTGVREASGAGARRYVAFLQDQQHLLAVMVCTDDRSLTEDEVREFFASIRP